MLFSLLRGLRRNISLDKVASECPYSAWLLGASMELFLLRADNVLHVYTRAASQMLRMNC